MGTSRRSFLSHRLAAVSFAVLLASCSSMLGFDDLTFEGDAGDDASAGGQAGAGGSSAAGAGGVSSEAGQDADVGGASGTAGTAGTGGTSPPPFDCDNPPASPTLEPEVWTHPAQGVLAGQTVTVVLKSGNHDPGSAPTLVGELTNRDGTRQVTDYTLVGGGNANYYVSFADLAVGQNCILLRNGSNVEVAMKLDAADPGAGLARGAGPWKVTSNHQWRCDEQPAFGNLLHVRVEDENGNPVEGATVRIRWTDDTVYPVPPDDQATSWDEHGQPKSMTTGADGRAELVTPWGEGVRTPIDGKPGLVVFLLSMEGGASDTATEITTGLWEADASGCNYCNTYAINVYGHWSHTVVFRRDPTATQVCEVPIDHEGQQSCSHTHFYHDPDRPSCVPVAP